MGGGTICWRSKLQSIVTLSSTEAEYVGATPAVQEILWLRDLLRKLGIIDSPLTHEKRRPGAAMDVTVGPDAINHHASVGVTEIEGKIIEKTRKYAYLEALCGKR